MEELISRQQAIEDAKSWVGMNWYEQHLRRKVVEWLKTFPAALPEPLTMTDGTLFIDVPDVTQVKRVIATETGTKFCRQFYMDAQPEQRWIQVEQDTPKEDGDYWATFEAESGWFVDWCEWLGGKWVVRIDDAICDVSNVVAWCKPLDPYQPDAGKLATPKIEGESSQNGLMPAT